MDDNSVYNIYHWTFCYIWKYFCSFCFKNDSKNTTLRLIIIRSITFAITFNHSNNKPSTLNPCLNKQASLHIESRISNSLSYVTSKVLTQQILSAKLLETADSKPKVSRVVTNNISYQSLQF